MIGIVYATQLEAGVLLKRLAATRCTKTPFEVYRFGSDGVVIISGMGKEKARAACTYLFDHFDITCVVNAGICGALSDRIHPGDIMRVELAHDGDVEDTAPLKLEMIAGHLSWADLPTATLTTLSEPVFDEDRRAHHAKTAELVDMEGAAVASACRERDVPCCLLKGVSDRACSKGRRDLKRNLKAVSKQIAEVVAREIAPETSSLTTMEKLHQFTRLEHTIFSLPLLFAGAWLGAGGSLPPLRVLALIAVAGTGARTFGMALNRIFDRNLDALNERTASRLLPRGHLSLAKAYGVAAVGLLAYLGACAGLGRICLLLAPVPVLPLMLYSLLKRFTNLCHYGIGVCLGLAPLGAFVAVTGSLDFSREVILLALFTLAWISGFDIIYALLDIDADRRNGVHSLPASLGSTGAQWIAAATHAVAGTALYWLWLSAGGGIAAGIALGVALTTMAVAYWQRIPIHVRFFPVSAIAGVAGAMVPML